jgi:hypothetical protein
MGVGAECTQVLVWGIARDFATGSDDIARAGLSMAGGNGSLDCGGIAIAEGEDGMKISKQHLIRAHGLAGQI